MYPCEMLLIKLQFYKHYQINNNNSKASECCWECKYLTCNIKLYIYINLFLLLFYNYIYL